MHVLLGNNKPGKPAIHGSVLATLPLTEKLAWLAAIATGEANLLSLILAQLPRAFEVSPTALREARRAAGQTIKSRRHKPAAPAPTPSPESAPIVDVVETLRKIGPEGFLKLAEMADEITRVAAAAKANSALNGGAPAHAL
jgi:hypothetical protein